MAWKSPVKWRLIFSMGNTWAYPPPAAPPFIPKQGPREGSRSATTARLPIWLRPSARPMLTVVLPIPAFVAVIEVTRMRWLHFTFDSSMSDRGTLATCCIDTNLLCYFCNRQQRCWSCNFNVGHGRGCWGIGGFREQKWKMKRHYSWGSPSHLTTPANTDGIKLWEILFLQSKDT